MKVYPEGETPSVRDMASTFAPGGSSGFQSRECNDAVRRYCGAPLSRCDVHCMSACANEAFS